MTPNPYPVPDASGVQGLWIEHKNVLHRLYISENKPLSQVKKVMESVHGFPELRLHDYEVALREVLKLRKNLKKEDWYTIGIYISNRRRQGIQTEVLWNNRPMAAKKVRKEVLRNRNLGKFRITRTELPVGITIRTPTGSSPTEHLALVPSGSIDSDQTSDISLPDNDSSDFSQVGSPNRKIQIATHEFDQLGASRFRCFREDLPFNRFMLEVMALGRCYPSLSTVSARWNHSTPPRLFGGNPSLGVLTWQTFQLSNNLHLDWKSDDNRWFLDWFSRSAEFGLLRTFFSIKSPTVCAVYERLCKKSYDLLRPALTRVLFEIKDAVNNKDLIMDTEVQCLVTAVRVGSRADGMLQLANRAFECISTRLRSAALFHRLANLSLVAAARRDIAMLRFLVGALTQCDDTTECVNGNAFLLARVMRQLYTWDPGEPEDGGTIVEYVHLLIQGGILSTSLSPRCCWDDRPKVQLLYPGSFTVDELIMICPPTKRHYLFSVVCHASAGHETPTIAGIFTAAVNGADSILAYLQSCEQMGAADTETIMQECLVFSATLNDLITASAMLDLGTDPQASLLSNNQEHYHKGMLSWDPMIVAAAAGSLEILRLFKENTNTASFLENAPVYEIIQEWDVKPRYGKRAVAFLIPYTYKRYGNRRGSELRRLENLQRHYVHSQTYTSDIAMADGTICSEELHSIAALPPAYSPIEEGRRIGTLAWIRNAAMALGISESFDKEIISTALLDQPGAPSAKHKDSAYHPCDVLLLDGLVDDNLDYHEGDLDLLQLSIYSQCSLKVVELLLSKGLRVHSRPATQSGNTMLHDALLSNSHDRSQIVHLLVREGADYKYSGTGLSILEASLELEEVDFHRSQRGSSPNLGIFTFLFEAGAPVRRAAPLQVQERQPLVCRLLAANAEDEFILRVLDAGANLNGRGTTRDPRTIRMTPLEATIFRGREGLAEQLIQRGADVHTPADDIGTLTALQLACYMGCSLHFIEYLIKEQGADVNEKPALDSGFTALQGAAACGSLSLSETLLAHGADVNALGGMTEYLSQHFGDPWIHLRSPRWRALDLAALAGRLDIVEFLLKAGGRSGTTGLDGAIAIAKTQRHFAILSVLLDWEKEHGSTFVVEEAEWQQQNPDWPIVRPNLRGDAYVSNSSNFESEDSVERGMD